MQAPCIWNAPCIWKWKQGHVHRHTQKTKAEQVGGREGGGKVGRCEIGREGERERGGEGGDQQTYRFKNFEGLFVHEQGLKGVTHVPIGLG